MSSDIDIPRNTHRNAERKAVVMRRLRPEFQGTASMGEFSERVNAPGPATRILFTDTSEEVQAGTESKHFGDRPLAHRNQRLVIRPDGRQGERSTSKQEQSTHLLLFF